MSHDMTFEFKDATTDKVHKLNLEDIMHMTNIFVHARKIIVTNEERFICYAIRAVSNEVIGLPNHILNTAQDYVMSSLVDDSRYNPSFGAWIRNTQGIDPSDEYVKQTRMVWLDQTIARFTEILKQHNYPF